MNYEQLRAAIQQYSLNFEASFVSNIDLFIHLAEARLRFNVQLPNFTKYIPGALTAGAQLWDTPPDFLSPNSLQIIDGDELSYAINKDPEFLDECYPSASIRGRPRFYSYVNEDSLKLGPTPDYPYPITLGYFYQPPSITVTGTSWLGDHFEHALVSGSLVEAAKYMKSEDSLYQRYDAAWKEDLQMDLAFSKGRTDKDTYQE